MQSAVGIIQADLLSQRFFTSIKPPRHTHAKARALPNDLALEGMQDPVPRLVISHSLASYSLLHDHHLNVDLDKLALASKRLHSTNALHPTMYYQLGTQIS